MAPHQQRVVDEKSDLDEKISKLRLFFRGCIFSELPMEERARMLRQVNAMQQYSNVLGERIAAF